MADSSKGQQYTGTAGDMAVDGLLAGGAGGVIMAAYLVVSGLIGGPRPIETLGLFDASGTASAAVGLITHLAVSGVYGALFGLGWGMVSRLRMQIPAWLGGVVYSLMLLTVALAMMLPAAASPLLTISPVHFAIAHGLYGLTLGLVVGRRHNSDR